MTHAPSSIIAFNWISVVRYRYHLNYLRLEKHVCFHHTVYSVGIVELIPHYNIKNCVSLQRLADVILLSTHKKKEKSVEKSCLFSRSFLYRTRTCFSGSDVSLTYLRGSFHKTSSSSFTASSSNATPFLHRMHCSISCIFEHVQNPLYFLTRGLAPNFNFDFDSMDATTEGAEREEDINA